MFRAVLDKFREVKRRSLLGQLVVLLLGVQLLFFSSFAGLSLPTPTGRNLVAYGHSRIVKIWPYLSVRVQDRLLKWFPSLRQTPADVRYSLYVPQTPMAVFVGYILGSFLGPLAVLLFLFGGLVGPYLGIYTFACGGGLDYYRQPGFGYLMGTVLASWCVGKLTFKKRTTFRQLMSVVCGLFAVHVVGIGYLLGICLVTAFIEAMRGPLEWQQWLFEEIRNLSWYALPYDFLFCLLLVGLGFPFKWLVNILTAPDVTVKAKQPPRLEELA